MVKGLANAHGANIVNERADEPFNSVDDLWRRVRVPVAALTQLANADAFRPDLGLARREALWAIRGLRDEPLPLFAAATAREQQTVSELREPTVALRPMAAGGEVVQDYANVGLSLRAHPVAFLRADLDKRKIITCLDAMQSRDGRWVEIAGIVLVRQKPGSAKGVMFITLEDESGIANIIVWPKNYDNYRRVILGATMMGVRGRVQREGEVVHLIAHQMTEHSAELSSIGERGGAFLSPHGRGDEFHYGGPEHDNREPKLPRARDILDPYDHIKEIKVKSRDFR
jgi:error-prone DNA polymerase